MTIAYLASNAIIDRLTADGAVAGSSSPDLGRTYMQNISYYSFLFNFLIITGLLASSRKVKRGSGSGSVIKGFLGKVSG